MPTVLILFGMRFYYWSHELALAEQIIGDNSAYMIEHWRLYFKK